MPRYIDADALRQRMYHEAFETDTDMQRWDSGCWIRYKLFENCLESMPTASPDEVRGVGEWIVKQTAIGKDYTICSVCETDFKFKTDKGTLARLDMCGMAYCPHCGARMKGAEDD